MIKITRFVQNTNRGPLPCISFFDDGLNLEFSAIADSGIEPNGKMYGGSGQKLNEATDEELRAYAEQMFVYYRRRELLHKQGLA